jgi:hypothetical protein
LAKRISFRTKGGKMVSFLAKGKATRRRKRTLKTRRSGVKKKRRSGFPMARRRRSRARRVYSRARRSYSSTNRLMRGILPVSGPISKAIAGVGVATMQERFLPQVIPYQSVAVGFIIGGLPGAAGAFAKGMLVGNGNRMAINGGNY